VANGGSQPSSDTMAQLWHVVPEGRRLSGRLRVGRDALLQRQHMVEQLGSLCSVDGKVR